MYPPYAKFTLLDEKGNVVTSANSNNANDILLKDSALSARVKNILYNKNVRDAFLEGKDFDEIKLSDVAKITFSNLVKVRGCGDRTAKEICLYLKERGFKVSYY